MLTQFLTESVIFSQIGGVIGIIGGTILGNIVSVIMGVPLLMPWDTTTSILQIPYLNLTPLGMNILAIVFVRSSEFFLEFILHGKPQT